MWDTPFDESMLGLKQGVVIRCPEEHLAWELFEIFEQNGIGENWKREDWNPNWGSYREETAYFVKGKKLLYGQRYTQSNMVTAIRVMQNVPSSAILLQTSRPQVTENCWISSALGVQNNVGHAI